MTAPEQNSGHETNSTSETGRTKRGTGKTLFFLVLLLAAGVYVGRPYLEPYLPPQLKRALAVLPGGNKAAKPQATMPMAPPAPTVILHTVEKADLAVSREYVGRVEPIQTVSLLPQISGIIEEVHFKEGSMVKAGDLLFTIDSKEYKTTVALRKAELAKAEATLDRASKYLKRLKAADARSVSATDLDQAESDVLQNQAAVEQAKASLQLAQINLGYTRITAPISGKAGKVNFTRGNYVTPSSGTLTSIVQMDPVRVTFSLPDRDYLDQFDAFRSAENVYDATIRLPNGDAYPEKGTRDFEDNVMDAKTGTITVALRFKNDRGALVPGSMVRVSVKPVTSRTVPVIPQEAILADSAGDFVYVVDGENVAHKRPVRLGAAFGRVSEVASGLEPGERIILLGLQSVRPEMKVNPTQAATNGNGTKTPAERARESDYDPQTVSADVSGDKTASAEGSD